MIHEETEGSGNTRIGRLRVNGGFLSGLDTTFVPGLNVIVGPRGSGKTTLLELIRHGVGAKKASETTTSSKAKKEQYGEHLIGNGELVLDLVQSSGNTQIVTDAEGGGRGDSYENSILYLGQSEIEEISESAALRRELVDMRGKTSVETIDDAPIRQATQDAYDLRTKISEMEERLRSLSILRADREPLRQQEKAILDEQELGLSEKRQELKTYEAQCAESDKSIDNAGAIRQKLAQFAEQNRQAERILSNVDAAVNTLEYNQDELRSLEKIRQLSDELISEIETIDSLIGKRIEDNRDKSSEARRKAVPIREELERSEKGLGELTSKIQRLDKQISNLDRLNEEKQDLQRQLSDVLVTRERLLDEVEEKIEAEYESRGSVAHEAVDASTPNISIEVAHLADAEDYYSLVKESLEGSRLRSGTIDSVVDNVIPRELLDLVENSDIEGLSEAASISESASTKIVDFLDNLDTLLDLASIRLQDKVDFFLVDGTTKKSVANLSTGQKCAVTLPILLSERTRTLILDQPEDHLDNAYLVQNIVRSIERRTKDGVQTIVATHNPNIPVLGSAENVMVMASNGISGEVKYSGSFDKEQIVGEITSVMEGGKEAFQKRSIFYARHEANL